MISPVEESTHLPLVLQVSQKNGSSLIRMLLTFGGITVHGRYMAHREGGNGESNVQASACGDGDTLHDFRVLQSRP